MLVCQVLWLYPRHNYDSICYWTRSLQCPRNSFLSIKTNSNLFKIKSQMISPIVHLDKFWLPIKIRKCEKLSNFYYINYLQILTMILEDKKPCLHLTVAKIYRKHILNKLWIYESIVYTLLRKLLEY